MYAKIFTQILDSSISRNPELRHIWIDLLLLADQDGIIDMPIDAIAIRTRLPEERIRWAIDQLTSPDPDSRSPAEEGRRLIPLEGRPWGWQVVNYIAYRETRNEGQRRRQNAEAQARRRAKQRAAAEAVTDDATADDNDKSQPQKLTNADVSVRQHASASASASVAVASSFVVASEEGVQGGKQPDTPESPEIPPELDTPEFRAEWPAYLDYRDKMPKAKRLTPDGQRRLLKRLAKFGPVWACERIDQAIASCWQGLIFDGDEPGKPAGNAGRGNGRGRYAPAVPANTNANAYAGVGRQF